MPLPRLFPKLILLAFLALAACESAEERAERYYQSGLALLEEGDVDRALVEFRNVFAANPRHVKARLAYADAQRERGLVGDAYGQYVRLIEQEPENAEALIALSEISILSNSWEDAVTYGRTAEDVAPTDLRVTIVGAMLDYREAVIAEEDASAPVRIATAGLENDPTSVIARKVVIDHAIIEGDVEAALQRVAEGLAIDPGQAELHLIRIGLLREGDDPAKVQAALEEMAAQFPESTPIRQELLSWYIGQDDVAAAEAYLRDLAALPDATEAQKVTVVDFLRQSEGLEAAKAELERLIATEQDNGKYRVLRASILFSQDEPDAAISEVEESIAAGGESDATRDFKIVLARMLEVQGDVERAQSYVAEVLEEDAGHIDALTMQAQWSIAADDPNEAIILLRQGLAQAPRDLELITLLGEAHERAGDHDLAGERYALAVEVSGRAVGPSLRHAEFLLGRNRVEAAEAVIVNALDLVPQNPELLVAMADIQLRQGEWNQVTRVIWQLRALDTPLTTGLADRTEVALLNRQQRFDETRDLLEAMIADGETGIAAKAQLVEAQIRAGRLDDARAFLKEELVANPDDPTLRFLEADILVMTDDLAGGEAVYRELLDAYPENEQVFSRLYGLLTNQDRRDDADALLDEVLAKAPGAMMVSMVKASRLEALSDFEGAIAIYEDLYARDSGNMIVANNLASMITARRDDDDSLDRAYAISARLRGSDVPQFQDTVGWIAYRRGNYADALRNLEPAAAGLPGDPLTQYHLGVTYIALERHADARASLERAIAVGEGSDLPQLERARTLLVDLPE